MLCCIHRIIVVFNVYLLRCIYGHLMRALTYDYTQLISFFYLSTKPNDRNRINVYKRYTGQYENVDNEVQLLRTRCRWSISANGTINLNVLV